MSLPLTSLCLEKSLSMFDWNRREACWAMCRAGSNIDVSDAVESKKMWNSRMSGVPSMVLMISLDICESAIISASWSKALLAKGTMCLKRTWPAWMLDMFHMTCPHSWLVEAWFRSVQHM